MTSSDDDCAKNHQRALAVLRDDLWAKAPRLKSQAVSEIKNLGLEHFVLLFQSGERGCVIDLQGDQNAHAAFLWNDRPMFESRFDERHGLARLIRRWVCDAGRPSDMRTEFPDLEIDELADYYERGEPVVGEFMRSWDAIEAYYTETKGGDYFKAVRGLIRSMREAGYDRQLRAGQSMASFGLSRSHEQGLREDQPRLWFDIGPSEMDVDANFGDGELLGHPVRLTAEVRKLLDGLAQCAID